MKTFTPGPWALEYDFSLVMGGQVVGQAPAPDGASEEEIAYNATLIAAAPELLTALINAVTRLKLIADCPPDEELIDTLEDVIKNAQGE
jgi:hypothetical protein